MLSPETRLTRRTTAAGVPTAACAAGTIVLSILMSVLRNESHDFSIDSLPGLLLYLALWLIRAVVLALTVAFGVFFAVSYLRLQNLRRREKVHLTSDLDGHRQTQVQSVLGELNPSTQSIDSNLIDSIWLPHPSADQFRSPPSE
jgi:hypothetical protein